MQWPKEKDNKKQRTIKTILHRKLNSGTQQL